MSLVLYPVAYDSMNNEVWAKDAERGRYKCIECGGEMVLRYGKRVTRHFAHLVDQEGSGRKCSPESIEHILAKARLEIAINAWASGEGDEIIICQSCFCGTAKNFHLSNIRLRSSNGKCLDRLSVVAKQEARVGTYIGDVVVYEREDIRCVLEVRKSHAVGDDKARWLHRSGFMWFELEAAEVLRRPNQWAPINGCGIDCGKCKSIIAERARRKLILKWSGAMAGYRQRMRRTQIECDRITKRRIDEFNRAADQEAMLSRLFEAKTELRDIEAMMSEHRDVVLSMKEILDGRGRTVPELEPMETEEKTVARDDFLSSLSPDVLNLWVRYVEMEEPGSSSPQNAYRDATRRLLHGRATELVKMSAEERMRRLRDLDARYAKLRRFIARWGNQ